MQTDSVKIKKVSTVDAAANYLKEQIATGELRPGERLPSERILQKQLGVSRFTLREALARLSALGLISIAHGKGAFVASDLNSSTLGDVFIPLFAKQNLKNVIAFFEARMIMEREAVVLAAMRRTDDDLKRLKEILDQSKELLEEPARYAEMDFSFHNQIAAMGQNIFMYKMLGCLNDYVKKYLHELAMNPANTKRSHKSHSQIYKAVAAQDVELAGRITKEHLERTFRLITNLQEEEVGTLTPEKLAKAFE